MDNIKISSISSLDTIKLREVLSSQKLTDEQKAQFMRKNSTQIKDLMKTEISKQEFQGMMQDRPLIRFRPLKNSFTKQGDKILLSKSLGIDPKEVNGYVEHMATAIKVTGGTDFASEDIDKVKTYVYRHGSKDQVVAFLGHELSNVQMTLFQLYKTLEDNSGGLADYFSR